jgi:hypothetical protein
MCIVICAGRNGDLRLDDPRDLPSEDGALWGGYHGLGLKKSTRDQSVSIFTCILRCQMYLTSHSLNRLIWNITENI